MPASIRRPRLGLIAAIMATGLAGCNLIPEYQTPTPPVPTAWPTTHPDPGDQGDHAAALPGWQEYIRQPQMIAAIELALAHNRDLALAAASVARARALLQASGAALSPRIDLDAGATVFRQPPNPDNNNQAVTVRDYGVELATVSWEVDFFGRLASLEEAARQNWLAQSASGRALRIALVDATAAAWLELDRSRRLGRLATRTLASRERSLALVERRLAAGVATRLDQQQARTARDAALAEVERHRRSEMLAANALQRLLGTALPETLLPDPDQPLPELAGLSPGLPSEVLLARPDVMAAEHQLRAANASIGAARAAFWPSLRLTAGAGTASNELSRLFSGGSGVWSFIPNLTQPIFDAGGNQARLDVSLAERDAALARFEATIQTAFREVADALAWAATSSAEIEARQAQVEGHAASLALAEQRYQAGIDSYLPVLDAERSLYVAQLGLMDLKAARERQKLQLFKALGGAPEAPPRP